MHEEGRYIALDYASRGGYGSNVIRVRIPRADFEKHFKDYVLPYDGRPGVQIAIPKEAFGQLNKHPRSLAGG